MLNIPRWSANWRCLIVAWPEVEESGIPIGEGRSEEDLDLSEGIPFSFAFAASSFSNPSVLSCEPSVRRASRCRCSSMTLAISSLLGPAGVSGCGIKVALAIIPSLMSDLARSTDSLEESLQSSARRDSQCYYQPVRNIPSAGRECSRLTDRPDALDRRRSTRPYLRSTRPSSWVSDRRNIVSLWPLFSRNRHLLREPC